MPTARKFSDMTALLVGATSGMGLEIAAQLGEAGVPRITVNGRDAARGADAVMAIATRSSAQAVFREGDASAPTVIAQLVENVGPTDILVHAVPGTTAPAPFEHLATVDFEPLIRAHLISALLVTHAALPGMIARGGGTILFIASDAAKLPTPGESVHGALMAAIVMFARTLAVELSRHGIRVHALTPSIVADTMSYDRMMADPFSAKLFTKAIGRARLGLPTPCDIAALAVFLASPAAARMTGQVITVNGGLAVA